MKGLILPGKSELKEIREALFSREKLRNFPLEVIHRVLSHWGFEDLPDVVELLDDEKLEGIVAYHCWLKDEPVVEGYLELVNHLSSSPHSLLRLIQNTDHSFLSLFLASVSEIYIFEEKEEYLDREPAFTLDGGYTWFIPKLPDHDKQVLTRMFIELLAGTGKKYSEAIALASGFPPTQLKEEAYKRKEQVLANFGIPDEELRRELLEPVPLSSNYSSDFSGVLPVKARGSLGFYPLENLIARFEKKEFVDLLRNIVFAILIEYRFPLFEHEIIPDIEVFSLAAINLGLQKMIAEGKSEGSFTHLEDIKLAFKVGFHDILFFHKKFSSINCDNWDVELRTVVEAVRNFPPKVPKYFSSQGLIHDKGSYPSEVNYISNLGQLKALKELLQTVKLTN
ncbi:MAG: DUF6178 family protein [Deltaproteobacteria bacterium]|nr:DUF6178 family protein [Deltaproteobacteria bacterium]